MKFYGHIDRVAKFLPNASQRFNCRPQLLRRDMIPTSLSGNWIERPDLHGSNVAGKKFLGKLRRATEKIDSVVAGIVDANGFPGCATQELVDRLICSLAEQIPERDVDRTECSHFGAGPAAVRDSEKHFRPQPVNRARIPTQ